MTWRSFLGCAAPLVSLHDSDVLPGPSRKVARERERPGRTNAYWLDLGLRLLTFLQEKEERDNEAMVPLEEFLGALQAAGVQDVSLEDARFVAQRLSQPTTVMFLSSAGNLAPAEVKRASLTLDKAALSFPVFVRANLVDMIEHGEVQALPDLSYAHMTWGGAETATVRAFANPEETRDLRAQIIEQQGVVEGALAQLEPTTAIQERLQHARLAAKAIETDAEAVVLAKRERRSELEQAFGAAQREASAVESILRCEEIPLRDELATLYPIARGHWDKMRAIKDLEEKRQPWATGAEDVHAIANDAQKRFKKVLRVEREFGLKAISLDAAQEPSVQAAIRLKDAVSKCLREGLPVKDAVSSMRAGIDNLDITELRSDLLQADDAVSNATSTTHLAVSTALQGDTSLTEMQRKAFEEEAQTPDGLFAAAARFGNMIEVEADTNKRSKDEVETMEDRAIDFLVGMLSEVRRRLRLLQVAMTEGEGAKFIVECTLPNKDALHRVFADLMEEVKRVDRGARADLGAAASADDVRRAANRTLRKVVREKTKRKILLSPSVKIAHSAISGGQPVFLQDPDHDNPNRFSGGENTAIALAWIIRRAQYAITKEALRSRQYSAASSSFVILDGLFSDLSDKDLTREAMAPLKTLGGQFQIIAFVHPNEYLLKHDIEIFPVLNIGRPHGDGWKMLHIDADHWDPAWVVKEGTMGIAHFSVSPANLPRQHNDPAPDQGDAA